MFKKLIIILLAIINSYSYADGISALNQFLKNETHTITANFVQTVYGAKKNTFSSGTMEILRPNKFRWQYAVQNGVSGQLILSDGKLIYVYDKDLAQVTVKKLTNSLDRSPALLLANGANLNKTYNVKTIVSNDNLDWVTMEPKNLNDNNGFKKISIAFNKEDGSLAQMRFVDSFDNKSKIAFSNVKINTAFKPNEFIFIKPANTDVIKVN